MMLVVAQVGSVMLVVAQVGSVMLVVGGCAPACAAVEGYHCTGHRWRAGPALATPRFGAAATALVPAAAEVALGAVSLSPPRVIRVAGIVE